MVRTYADIRGKASRPATVVPLCLDGAALGEIRALERQLANAPAQSSLADRNPATAIVEQIEAIRARAAESNVDFHLRAIRGPDWLPFWASRPVAGDGESAQEFEVRWFAFMCQMVSLTVVDPVMTADEVAELVDDLPVDSWGELSDQVWNLNTNKVGVPFSAAAFALSQSSDETSKPPSDSGSPSASSGAAKPAKRPRTTTTKVKSLGAR